MIPRDINFPTTAEHDSKFSPACSGGRLDVVFVVVVRRLSWKIAINVLEDAAASNALWKSPMASDALDQYIESIQSGIAEWVACAPDDSVANWHGVTSHMDIGKQRLPIGKIDRGSIALSIFCRPTDCRSRGPLKSSAMQIVHGSIGHVGR